MKFEMLWGRAVSLGAEAIKFATVGTVATILHIATALIAHDYGLSSLTSNALAFFTAFLFSWTAHARWTFAGHTAGRKQFVRFFIISFSCLCLGQVVIWLIVNKLGLPFVAGLAFVVASVPAATFFGTKVWVFTQKNGIRAKE